MLRQLCAVLGFWTTVISSSPVAPSQPVSQNQKRQLPPDQFAGKPSSPTLQWFPCYPDSFPPLQCARLEVPYDYTKNKAGEIFKLALVKLPASPDVPYKGTQILGFLNAPFVDFAVVTGVLFHQPPLSGYDLIAWDPRGSGYTTPGLQCFANAATEASYTDLFSNQFRAYGGFNGSFPPTDKNIKSNIKSVTDTFQKLTDGCATYSSGILPYMGTADNARDLKTILSQLPNGQKNFILYGAATAIGLTYAAMYPTGFDSMTLDGAVNVEEYYESGLNSPSAVQDGDKALKMFFDSCAAAGANTCDPSIPIDNCVSKGCYFWRPTGKEVKARYEALKAKYYFTPFKSVPPNPNCGDCTLTYQAISHYLALALELPAAGNGDLAARAAKALLEIESGTAWVAGGVEYFATAFGQELDAYGRILPCLDAKNVICGTDDLTAHMKLMNRTSSQNGLAVAAKEALCSTFPKKINLKRRFTGNFETKKHNPMIFISNTADPEESRANARAIASRFANARFITVNEFGITTFFSGSSTCVQTLIGNWINSGVLPPRESVCNDVIPGPFGVGYPPS